MSSLLSCLVRFLTAVAWEESQLSRAKGMEGALSSLTLVRSSAVGSKGAFVEADSYNWEPKIYI